MGLRSEKAVSAHLLLENANESNLVSDISSRLSGRQPGPYAPAPPFRPSDVRRRRLCIWLLAPRGLRVPWRASILHNRGGQLCEEHHCTDIYRRSRVHGDWPRWHYPRPHTGKHRPHNCNPRQRRRRRHSCYSLQDRVRHRQKGAGKVARAIPRYRTDRTLRGKGRRVRNPYGRAASLLASLRTPAVGPRLRIYCIDYTQDFSGVLDREALVDHLCASEGFREQGDLAFAMRTDVPTILANTGSVGDHVCTWVRTSKAGYTVRTKCTARSYQTSRRARLANPLAATWPTISTAWTTICDAPSCNTMYRPGAALASKSLCMPAAGETSRRTRPKRWWWRPWPWFPPRVCQACL